MRRVRDLPSWLRDTALRMLPHATRPGLYPIGRPGRDAPVVCTGNYTLTVRRMRDALAGRDAWLLVANSRGINVWCAAGGGHFTHHDVIAALRATRVGDRVDHRTVILPQLGATGIERRRIADATGWRPVWGPARLDDLPAYLERGLKVRKPERSVTFPAGERVEMGLMWTVPMAAVAAVVLGLALGGALALTGVAVIAVTVIGLFLALPWLRVTGPTRWLTHAGTAVIGFALGAALLMTVGRADPGALVAVGITSAAAMGLLAIDLPGTTPCFPSAVHQIGNHFTIELVEDSCTGAAECVLVCPRDVLRMDGRRRKVTIAEPDQCIQCGACIVQCPDDALRFRFDDGRVVEPATVRRTRLNMLGRRTIAVPGDDPPGERPTA